MRLLPLAAAFAVLASSCPAFAPPREGDVSGFDMRSAAGNAYAISVWAPPASAGSPAKALYVLDGDETFDASATIASELLASGKAPPLLVVGIGYGTGSNERTRDYTPTVADGEGGGSAAFIAFVADELAPRIESEHPTIVPGRDGRIIDGHSFGGLAVLEALFGRPEDFSGFIASSPSLWWGRSVAFERAAAFLGGPGPTQAPKLYSSVGSHEGGGMDALFLAFAERMDAASASRLSFRHEVLAGKRHWDNRYIALRRGLAFVLGNAP